jgi:hypothetical protein
MYVERYCEVRSRNHCCSRKAISFEYVFVALVIQHEKCMHVVILSSVSRLAVQNFSYISPKKRTNFGIRLLNIIFFYFPLSFCPNSKKYAEEFREIS